MEWGHGAPAQRLRAPLTVRTAELADPGDLLSRLPRASPLAWVRHGEGLVGWGETARIVLPAGADRFAAAEAWLRDLAQAARLDDSVGLAGTGLVAFGSFTFDPNSSGSVLVVPAVVLGRRGGRAWLTLIGDPPPEITAHVAAVVNGAPDHAGAGHADPAVPDRSAVRPAAASAGGALDDGRWPLDGERPERDRLSGAQGIPGAIRWHDGSLPAPAWERAVAAAVDRIKSGRLGKVVLARDLYATAPSGIDVRLVLERLAGRYPDCYTFACGGLVGATPELLIRRQDADISSLVLAGTMPRGRDAAEDEALGQALLSSAKDAEEHEYAVAGVRATLGPLCEHLEVDRRPFLLRLANVQHLATAITGKVPWGPSGPLHSALSLVAALHPTGAVCGAPTEAALELIRELEGMDRCGYAGPVGWVDSEGNGEWGIALRCAEIDGPRARLFAGCGIVAGSDPAAELAEAQAKFRPMQFALEA